MKCKFCHTTQSHTDRCPNNPVRAHRIQVRLKMGRAVDAIKNSDDREEAINALIQMTESIYIIGYKRGSQR